MLFKGDRLNFRKKKYLGYKTSFYSIVNSVWGAKIINLLYKRIRRFLKEKKNKKKMKKLEWGC